MGATLELCSDGSVYVKGEAEVVTTERFSKSFDSLIEAEEWLREKGVRTSFDRVV